MKKIFAIFLGLIFLGAVFGIASVGAKPNGHCDCEIIGPSTVHVGDTFEVLMKTDGTCCSSSGSYFGFVEMVGESSIPTPDGYLYTYKAIRPGTPNRLVCCGYIQCDSNCYTVTVLPKALPMDKFMKIFVFGKKD